MARRPKPWWWKSRKAYYVTIDKIRHRLSEDKTEAERLFHLLMADPPEKKLSGDSVAAILDDFLVWCYENRAQSTAERYEVFLQSFVKDYGKIAVSSLHPGHVTDWAGRKNNLYKLVLMDVAEDAMTCACKMRRSRHGFAASFVWSLSNWTSGDVGNGRRRNRATPVGAGFRWWLVPPACRVQPSWRD